MGDELVIRFEGLDLHEVIISDVTGRVLYKHLLLYDETIDVSRWPKGVYTLTDRLVKNG